jgi:murein L,D-transpeptidase YafK
VVIDLEAYRLYLLENDSGRPRLVRDFYVSIGKGGGAKQYEGDEKTPTGVYLVSEYLSGERLPDLYGVGAFPISYPNGWDRIHGRTGSGIWIHGTESASYSRPPLSSRGCVTLSNADFQVLRRLVRVNETPVVVAQNLDWASPRELQAAGRELFEHFEAWRRDWERLDTDAYLGHYARDFRAPGMSRAAFADHKRRVNSYKRFVEIGVDDLGIYRYPGERDLVLVDFLQTYRSDNFESQKRKHQYWRLNGRRWRIVYEESV